MKDKFEGKVIRIGDYKGFVIGDGNIVKNSFHKIVKAPKGGKNGESGYWVNNTEGQPILIFKWECELIEDVR